MRYGQANGRDRAASLAGVALIHAVLGVLLVRGLAPQVFPAADKSLEVFELPAADPPPPEPPAIPPKIEERRAAPRPKDPEGAASPANLRDTPTPVVAPEPVVRLPVPPPITAALVAAEGDRASAGAADVPGPGTGAGGIGAGRGSGLYGDGTGGGGGGGTGLASRVRLVSGGIDDRDWPRDLDVPGFRGATVVRLTVSPRGRAVACRLVRTSGLAVLDRRTCDLAMRRFRFVPARDRDGRAISSLFEAEQEWGQSAAPEDIWIEPTIPDDE